MKAAPGPPPSSLLQRWGQINPVAQDKKPDLGPVLGPFDLGAYVMLLEFYKVQMNPPTFIDGRKGPRSHGPQGKCGPWSSSQLPSTAMGAEKPCCPDQKTDLGLVLGPFDLGTYVMLLEFYKVQVNPPPS